jgi:hypothetical protein
MTRSNLYALALVAPTLLGVPHVVHAAESYGNCQGFITTLPAVINASGTWCFNQDLSMASANGTAISITANDVTLDCNDFKLDGLAAGAGTQKIGISASDRRNTTIRHCNIRGFFYGLLLTGSNGGGHLVEDNRFDGNTFIALNVEGNGSVVRRNRVLDTGGSTQQGGATGIRSSYAVDILGNTIFGVLATSSSNGFAYGIQTLSNPSGSVIGNRVRGVVGDGSGITYGIQNAFAGRITLRDNDVTGPGNGAGLGCSDSNGLAKDNVVKGFASGISGCTDVGGNIVKP